MPGPGLPTGLHDRRGEGTEVIQMFRNDCPDNIEIEANVGGDRGQLAPADSRAGRIALSFTLYWAWPSPDPLPASVFSARPGI